MGKKAFDEKLAALEPLRRAPREEAEPALRKALKDRNNYYVARAAVIAGERGWEALVPDLLAAYEKFFVDAAKSDPQCWAKNALAAALRTLGHRESATYIRGLRHIQWEPVWGGQSDAAAQLRSTCAMALIDCPLPTLAVLRHLTPLLTDSDKSARANGVRAMAHIGDAAGALLLRLKAKTGDKEPEVMGQCLSAVLALEPGGEGVAFVEEFLVHPEPDVQLEAACVLAQSAERGALEAVKRYWDGRMVPSEIRRAILLNLGASPLREAADFLREVVETKPDLAAVAREALAASRFGERG